MFSCCKTCHTAFTSTRSNFRINQSAVQCRFSGRYNRLAGPGKFKIAGSESKHASEYFVHRGREKRTSKSGEIFVNNSSSYSFRMRPFPNEYSCPAVKVQCFRTSACLSPNFRGRQLGRLAPGRLAMFANEYATIYKFSNEISHICLSRVSLD